MFGGEERRSEEENECLEPQHMEIKALEVSEYLSLRDCTKITCGVGLCIFFLIAEGLQPPPLLALVSL